MLITRLNLRRTARFLNRGGFTLVELLVVIGIIAILAGVALGPITNGIKKAKQSSGLQSAHALGLAMYSAANDNSQIYPDKSGGSATAGDIAALLMGGGYVTDATIFSISSDGGTGFAKVTSATNTATSITQNQVSWDFLVNGGSGVDATKNTFLPILWSTLAPSGAPSSGNFVVTAGQPITATAVTTNPFGTDGVAAFYINNSAAFVTSTSPGAGQALVINLVSSANNLGATGAANYAPAYGK